MACTLDFHGGAIPAHHGQTLQHQRSLQFPLWSLPAEQQIQRALLTGAATRPRNPFPMAAELLQLHISPQRSRGAWNNCSGSVMRWTLGYRRQMGIPAVMLHTCVPQDPYCHLRGVQRWTSREDHPKQLSHRCAAS